MARAISGICLAGEPVRIAVAVVALVMVTHAEHELLGEERPDDVGAEDRVLAHELPLARVEAARLEQHAVGDADLADVVQVGGLLDLAEQLLAASRAPRRAAPCRPTTRAAWPRV